MAFTREKYFLNQLYVCEFRRIISVDCVNNKIKSIKDNTAILAITTENIFECNKYNSSQLYTLPELKKYKNKKLKEGMIYRASSYQIGNYINNHYSKNIYIIEDLYELDKISDSIMDMCEISIPKAEVYTKYSNKIYKKIR